MTCTERVKIPGVPRAQRGALPADTQAVFVSAKGAMDLYPELWIVVRETFTQLALPTPSSHATYCIYAVRWRELYSHSDTGKVLNVPVLQNMYLKSDVGAGRSLFALRAMESPQVCAHSDREPPRGLHWEENDLPPSLLPFHWSCSADSSHASVTDAFALGMWAQLSPKSTISYSFSKLSRGKEKEEGE